MPTRHMGRSADCMKGACKPPAARSGAGSLARLSAGPSGDRGLLGFKRWARWRRGLAFGAAAAASAAPPHLRLLCQPLGGALVLLCIILHTISECSGCSSDARAFAACLLARAAGGAAQRHVCMPKSDRSRRQRLPACGGALPTAAAAATAPGLVPAAQLLAVRCFGSMQRHGLLAHSSLKCTLSLPVLLQAATHAALLWWWRRWSMQGCCGRFGRHQPCRSRQHPPSCSSANSSWDRSDCTVRCTHKHCNGRSASMRRWHVNAGGQGVDSRRAKAEGCARAQGTQLKGPATEAQGDDGCTLSDTQG